MWIYLSRSGVLINPLKSKETTGYAGRGEGKNNPEMQSTKGIGPIPEGVYYMREPRESEVTGPYSIPLVPDRKNQMFGRASFAIHGDSVARPGEASHGCIILNRHVRQQMWESGDRTIKVVVD